MEDNCTMEEFMEDARKFAEAQTKEQLVELYLTETEIAIEHEHEIRELKSKWEKLKDRIRNIIDVCDCDTANNLFRVLNLMQTLEKGEDNE